MVGTRRTINSALHLGAASVALLFMVPAAGAVTCDEVRSLTAASRADWAKRLKVSPENLAILLERSFCQPKPPSGVIVSAREAKNDAADRGNHEAGKRSVERQPGIDAREACCRCEEL
jgi:hypothetical protein